jgi:hypothetical protein
MLIAKKYDNVGTNEKPSKSPIILNSLAWHLEIQPMPKNTDKAIAQKSMITQHPKPLGCKE